MRFQGFEKEKKRKEKKERKKNVVQGSCKKLNQVGAFSLPLFFPLLRSPMEGEERHAVGSAPARSSTMLLPTAKFPIATKTAALAAARSFDKAIPMTTGTAAARASPTPPAAAAVPSMSPLPSPSKEGSQRAGNLLQSIAHGVSRSIAVVWKAAREGKSSDARAAKYR